MVDGFRPSSLAEALEIRASQTCLPVAGGTDLMVQKARGFALQPDFDQPLLFIGHLQELKHISRSNNDIHIGAGVSLTDLLCSALIPDIFKKAIALMASPPSRNLASIGGNICNASPAGDTLPYLYAVDTKLVLKNRTGERIIPVQQFITGPKQTDLKNDELLIEIILPNLEFNILFYRKIGQRRGMSLTKAAFLGLAVHKNGRITDTRISFGSVAPTVVRSRKIEELLIGKSFGEIKKLIPEMLKQYTPLIQPIDDARSTALYRKKVSLNLLEEFLKKYISHRSTQMNNDYKHVEFLNTKLF
jgi:xanthine dehydrogenase FAD-binding subunit